MRETNWEKKSVKNSRRYCQLEFLGFSRSNVEIAENQTFNFCKLRYRKREKYADVGDVGAY